MNCAVPTQTEVMAVIERMRQQGTDDGLCEAKSCEHELGRSVWASVSAFANTNGGLLLLGIDENANFTVPEGFDANKVIAQFIDGIGDGSANGARLTKKTNRRTSPAMSRGEGCRQEPIIASMTTMSR